MFMMREGKGSSVGTRVDPEGGRCRSVAREKECPSVYVRGCWWMGESESNEREGRRKGEQRGKGRREEAVSLRSLSCSLPLIETLKKIFLRLTSRDAGVYVLTDEGSSRNRRKEEKERRWVLKGERERGFNLSFFVFGRREKGETRCFLSFLSILQPSLTHRSKLFFFLRPLPLLLNDRPTNQNVLLPT